MEYANLFILASFILVYSLVAVKVETLPLSGPIFFVFFGVVMGPAVLNVLNVKVDGEVYKTLAELSLALV